MAGEAGAGFEGAGILINSSYAVRRTKRVGLFPKADEFAFWVSPLYKGATHPNTDFTENRM